MRHVFTLRKFAKKMGFKSCQNRMFRIELNYLIRINAVEIQQGGFRAHSMYHPKIVVIRDVEKVKARFGVVMAYHLHKQEKKKLTSLLESEEPEMFFDYVGYVERVLEHIPRELISERVAITLFDFVVWLIFEVNLNVEEDKRFELTSELARGFLELFC